MGPEATVEFQRRLIAAIPARDDIDHLHVLVDNNPKVPSRIAALIDKTGEDPAPVLCAMAQGLERQGADFLTMPCNTAHYYLPQIAAAVRIPVLDMIALSIAAFGKLKAKRIGMLASPAVRMVGLIEQRLKDTGYDAVFPDPANDAKLFDVIKAVKAGRTGDAERAATIDVARSLIVDGYLIACTELSVLTPLTLPKPAIDTLDVLVAATVAEAKGRSA
ncbi:MAG: aspartate/glutamate racemase family protein [Alphaproteobacteria bacterium]|nr:aspartate/glutamate racemase family protein [Alphaproteobacteria bacterium]